MARVAMIGATGLIGRRLAPLLVAAGHELIILGRRPSGVAGAAELVGPIDAWPEALAGWQGEVAISTLGTTWKKAGSWPTFRAVDHDAVLAFARAARAASARQFVTVSSVGADAASRSTYLALKGEVESVLATIGFDRLDIIRPGLLRGDRGGDRRVGERIGILVSPVVNLLLRGSLDRYAAIDGALVAKAMAGLVGNGESGTHLHHNRDLLMLAKRGG